MTFTASQGGNDSNNMLIPLDNGKYNEYSAPRPLIALPQSACLPLTASGTGGTYGFHPAFENISQLYNNGNALVVANVGPLKSPATKSQLTLTPSLIPEALLSHPAGSSQWESASTESVALLHRYLIWSRILSVVVLCLMVVARPKNASSPVHPHFHLW